MHEPWHHRMAAYGSVLARAAANAIFPPVCLVCRKPVDDAGHLCSECWGNIHFLDGPVCDSCGVPFEFETFEDQKCAACIASPPDYAHARAVFVYDDASKPLVLSLKHGDRTDFAPTLAAWLHRSGKHMLTRADILVPVPLHWRRRVSRRFNQSAELVRILSRITSLPAGMTVLERMKPGPSQGTLSRRARNRNVAGVFRTRDGTGDLIADKHVILIDDVLTTGATANACARALSRGGARQVDVLTLARVALPQQVAI